MKKRTEKRPIKININFFSGNKVDSESALLITKLILLIVTLLVVLGSNSGSIVNSFCSILTAISGI